MKMICLIALCFSMSALASHQKDCEIQLKDKRMEMNSISSNIANINTTRTPAGGPYQKQTLRCRDGKCDLYLEKSTILKYEPGHPDSNENGYVEYPDINMTREMNDLMNAKRDYEEILIFCKSDAVTN